MGSACSRRRGSGSSGEGTPGLAAGGNAAAQRRRIAAQVQRQVTAAVAARRRLALLRFKTAVRRIIHLLLLRKRWAAYGRILQQLPRRDLWTGLERRGGRLVRIRPAGTGAGTPARHRRPQGVAARTIPLTPEELARTADRRERLARDLRVNHASPHRHRDSHGEPEYEPRGFVHPRDRRFGEFRPHTVD